MLALVSSASGLSAHDLEPHRRLLWGVCYRMTGVAADADELVQETFLRALASPPADRSRELAPWLVRVATNAARDRLRRRKRERYDGPWLPSPIDVVADEPSPGARYDQKESASYGFLRALEALSATQRAVVVLRDVLDYSVEETAHALDLTGANVKTIHHRARAKLEGYESAREDRAQLEVARGAMTRFFAHLALNDLDGLTRLFTPDAEALTDGGGEFFAARVPVRTPERVAQVLSRLAKKGRVLKAVPCELSGLVAVVADLAPHMPGAPPRSITMFDVNGAGHILRVYGVVATRKILHLSV